MAEYEDKDAIDDPEWVVKRRILLWLATQPARRGTINDLNATAQWKGTCSKCGKVISKGQKIVTYYNPYFKEIHHKTLCFDDSLDNIILTVNNIPNHGGNVDHFITTLEMLIEEEMLIGDLLLTLLAEIAGRDISIGDPTVELRALGILNDRRGIAADPNLVEKLLTQLEQGASQFQVQFEASNLLTE